MSENKKSPLKHEVGLQKKYLVKFSEEDQKIIPPWSVSEIEGICLSGTVKTPIILKVLHVPDFNNCGTLSTFFRNINGTYFDIDILNPLGTAYETIKVKFNKNSVIVSLNELKYSSDGLLKYVIEIPEYTIEL